MFPPSESSDEGIPQTVGAACNARYELGERETRYLIQLVTKNWKKKLELAYSKNNLVGHIHQVKPNHGNKTDPRSVQIKVEYTDENLINHTRDRVAGPEIEGLGHSYSNRILTI